MNMKLLGVMILTGMATATMAQTTHNARKVTLVLVKTSPKRMFSGIDNGQLNKVERANLSATRQNLIKDTEIAKIEAYTTKRKKKH